MKKFFRNESGGVLPLVMMIFMVLFILGLSLLQIGMSDTVQSTWQSNRVQAHYLARSGIEIGDEMLKQQLLTMPQTSTLGNLVSLLNSATASSYTIDGVGEFTIEFSVSPLDEIKITSVGTTTLANPSATNTVTFTKRIYKGANFESAGSQWFHNNGFHFAASVFPDEGAQPNPKSFLGRIAYLGNTTKAIQNPSVGSPSNISVLRASILNFGEYNGVSVDASSNSYVKFDSEIVFFNGRIETKNSSYMQMLVSDKVLAQKTSDSFDTNYPNPIGNTPGGMWNLDFLEYDKHVGGVQVLQGFESNERYLAFISNFTSTPTTTHRPVSTAFEPGVKYGVVRLVRIDQGNTTVLTPSGKGYYYFPNGTRLDEAVSGTGYYGRNKLIPINDADPITSILDNLFKWNYGSTKGIWNYQ